MPVKDVSPKTKDSVLQLTGSFGPKGIVRSIMNPSTAKKDENFSFSGRAKVVKAEGKSASKITPLKEGNELIDMLLKIYSFLEKSHTEDVMSKEKQNNFREEQELESQRRADTRHKLLLDALAKLRSDMNRSVSGGGTEPGGFNFPNIPDFPDRKRGPGGSNKGKADKVGKTGPARDPKTGRFTKRPTATKMSKVLEGAKKLLGKLKSIPLLSTLAAGASMIMNIQGAIEQNENGEIDDKQLKKIITKEIAAALAGVGGAEIGAVIGAAVGGPVGALIGGVGGFAVGEMAGAEVADKLFDYYTNDSVKTKVNPITETEFDAMGNVIGEKEVTPPAPVKTTPVPTTSSRLNEVQSENNAIKIQPSQPSVATINNVVATSTPKQNGTLEKVPVPAVRNQEETFQKMIYYSTRVV